MAWAPEPTFPPHVLAEVVPDVLKAKNTIPHHDAQRVAAVALASASKALAKLPDDALRALGLRRL